MTSLQQLASDLEQLKAHVNHQEQMIRKDLDVLHGQRSATDLWVHALIASHPNPAELRRHVDRLAGQIRQDGVPDWAIDRFQAYTELMNQYHRFYVESHRPNP